MKIRAFLLAFCLIVLSAALTWAAQGNEAQSALENAVSSILSDIRSPEFANSSTRPQLVQKIERSVRDIFDFEEFSSRTVGPRWKTFSPAQKKAFADAFANLLFNTYLNKVTGYNGERVEYNGETVNPAGNRVEVKTILSMADGRKIPISYRMLPKNGAWRVYDVIIENISLVKNYRTQFASILKTATPEELAAKVNDRARELVMQGTNNAK